MKPDEEKEITRDEVRKEFQLERMTLFSDAVFAIVITLMAIEIRLPEAMGRQTEEMLHESLLHLLPVILAYIVSFAFIGAMWYSHLHIFSLLKDYDKGVVVRNMCFLFLIGLFPFSASLISTIHGEVQTPLFIYLGIIFACRCAQLVLQDYILIRRPNLRVNTNIGPEIAKFKRDKFTLAFTFIAFLLVCVTNAMIENPQQKPFAALWVLIISLALRLYKRRYPEVKEATSVNAVDIVRSDEEEPAQTESNS